MSALHTGTSGWGMLWVFRVGGEVVATHLHSFGMTKRDVWDKEQLLDNWTAEAAGRPRRTRAQLQAMYRRAGHKVVRCRLALADSHGDPLPANIYADFLDDHDHPEAAALLRQAFPLGPPTEGMT